VCRCREVAQSQQLTKLLWRETRVSNDAAHRKGVDRVVPGNGDDPHAIGHHNVLALAGDTKSRLLQRPNRVEVANAWDLRHGSDRNLDLSDLRTLDERTRDLEVLADGLLDVCECFLLGIALGPAPGQARD